MINTIRVNVARRDPSYDACPPCELHQVPYFDHMDVIDVLRSIQELFDPTLAFKYSCEEGKCGLCGVVVNGTPELACKRVVAPGEDLTIGPLPNFPLIKDLAVDREMYYTEQRALQDHVERPADEPGKPLPISSFDDYADFKDCVECGLCSADCPASQESAFPHAGPAGFLQAIRSVLFEGSAVGAGGEELFHCFLCGRCEITCPRQVPITRLNRNARGVAKNGDSWPPAVCDLLSKLNTSHSLVGAGIEGTFSWLEHAPPEVTSQVGAEAPLGVFVGCQFGGRRSRSRTQIRLVELLVQAEVEFTLLGPNEWCCGHPNILAGDPGAANEFATHNIEAFRRLGVESVVAACPGCLHAWRTEYSEALGESLDLRVWHTSEFLLELVREGRIRLKGTEVTTAIYHDPCELGRLQGVYNAPRKLIHLTHTELVDSEPSRELGRCCGAGGLVLAADRTKAVCATTRRLQEIGATSSSPLITSCPNCEFAFETVARASKMKLDVLDVIDLVYLSAFGRYGVGTSRQSAKRGKTQ